MGLLEWLQDPRRTQAVQGIGSAIQSGLLGIQQGHQRFQDLQKQAFADPTNPARVTNPQAMNELAQMGMGLLSFAPAGLTVFHGSPAKFTNFDPTKIGTGEGAQAYGYGHYVAESPNVAKDYQKRLSDSSSPYTYEYGGQVYEKGANKDPVAHAIGLTYHQNQATAKRIAKQGLEDAKKGDAFALDMGGVDYYQKMLDVANKIKKSDIKATQGSFYKIDLPDEQIAKMLDWDKPLTQQPAEVQDALKNSNIAEIWKSQYGVDIEKNKPQMDMVYKAVSDQLGSSDAASKYFKDLGIPGIRYLDQGSRGVGEGTSNFVVFPGNEDLLKILERNNQPLGLLE